MRIDAAPGCGVVEPQSDIPLDQFLARTPCFLKEQLDRFCAKYLARRPRSLLEPDDLVHEVVTRLLSDPSVRRGGFGRGLPAFLGYLRQIAVRCAISAERSQRGRVRCGNCRHFASYSGICLKEGHALTHVSVSASQDPRTLSPSCREFVAKREALGHSTDSASLAITVPDPVDRGEIEEAVNRAMVALAMVHPRAALVVRARLFDGRAYQELSEVEASVRTMKRDFSFGMDFLRQKLHEFADPMAPSQPKGRSSGSENNDP